MCQDGGVGSQGRDFCAFGTDCADCGPRARPPSMILHLLSLDDPAALCLDGTSAGFYYRRGRPDRWVLFFEGGGWCYTPAQCHHRAEYDRIGSSKNWAQTMQPPHFGPLSLSSEINPDFHNYSHVLIKYCDGASFAGDAELHTHGTTLHFRGRRILDATLSALQRPEYGLGASVDTHVLLTGCSAGGLAVFLHADRVREALPQATVTKFKAAPGSGFFLHTLSVEGDDIYGWEMRQVYHMQNLSASLSVACQAAQPRGEAWRCAMAPYAAAFVRTPLFVLDSAIDKWQMMCIHAPHAIAQDVEVGYMSECGAAPSAGACAHTWGSSLGECTPSELTSVREYALTFGAQLAHTGILAGGAGHGAFITSCFTHCGFVGADWTQARLPLAQLSRSLGMPWPSPAAPAMRTYSMQEALGAWWHHGEPDIDNATSTANTTAAAVYLPCELVLEPPSQCMLAASCPGYRSDTGSAPSPPSLAPGIAPSGVFAYGGALAVASALCVCAWQLRRKRGGTTTRREMETATDAQTTNGWELNEAAKLAASANAS